MEKTNPEPASKPFDIKESRDNLTKLIQTLSSAYNDKGILTIPEDKMSFLARGVGAGIAYFCNVTQDEDKALIGLFRRLAPGERRKVTDLMSDGTAEMVLSNVLAAREARLDRERKAAEIKQQQRGPDEAVA